MKRQKLRFGAVVRLKKSGRLGVVRDEQLVNAAEGKYGVGIVLSNGDMRLIRHDWLVFVRDPEIKVTERCTVGIRRDLAGGRHIRAAKEPLLPYVFAGANLVDNRYVQYDVHTSWRERYDFALVYDAENIARRMKFYGALPVGLEAAEFDEACRRLPEVLQRL